MYAEKMAVLWTTQIEIMCMSLYHYHEKVAIYTAMEERSWVVPFGTVEIDQFQLEITEYSTRKHMT